ncbi:MAG: peptidylprolyl isomerase [Verrucomicrobiota bacterium]
MKNILKKLVAIPVLVSAICWPSSVKAVTNPEAKKADALFSNPVVAKGKGFEIKQNEIEDAFIDYKANMASRGQTVPEDQRAIVESNLLQRIIITKVLVNRATDADKVKAKEATEKLVAAAKKQFPNEEQFIQQLKATGLSFEQFKARGLEQTLCEVVIEREIKSKITVTEEEAKKFYDENPARFERPETVRAAHVLISTVDKDTQKPLAVAVKKEKEALAKTVKQRAEKGEDFGKLAKEFSDDPGSKDKNGEYTFARGEMAPEFETAAFSLKTNQVSDVVETRFGFHIIKTLQKIPPEKLEFAKVLPDLKEGLATQETQKQMPEYFEKIKKEAAVEIVDGKKPALDAPEKLPAK